MNVKSVVSAARTCVVLAAGLFLPATAAAASPPDVKARLVAPERLAAGTKATVKVELTFGAGWHANSHTPSEEFLVPTDVALQATGAEVSEVRYPKDVTKRFSFSEKPLRVYDGTVAFEADLAVPASARGKVEVRGTVSYQACNDTQCFAPASLPVTATVAVAAAGSGR